MDARTHAHTESDTYTHTHTHTHTHIHTHTHTTQTPAHDLRGFQIKPLSLAHSDFDEVLLVDADATFLRCAERAGIHVYGHGTCA